MKIKITHPVIEYDGHYTTSIPAGYILEVPDKKAKYWIDRGWAFAIVPEPSAEIPQTESVKDEPAVKVEEIPKKKRGRRVKHD